MDKILYLPHSKSNKQYTKKILNAVDDKRLKEIKDIKQASKCDVLVTDVSNLAFSFSLFYKKPSILFLSGFTSLDFGEDRLYKLLENLAYPCYSLSDLKEVLVNLKITSEQKEKKIQEFLEGDLF